MRTLHIALAVAVLLVCAGTPNAQRPEAPSGDEDVWHDGPPHRGQPWREGSDVRRMARERMMSHRMTEAQEEATLEFLERLDPEVAVWFRQMKLTSPMRYRRMLNAVAFRIAMMEREAAGDTTALVRERAVMRLQMRVESLSQQYRRAGDDDSRDAIRAEMRGALDELFDLREAEKRAHLERMARELERLRAVIAERRENKDEIVERRLLELTGERETLEW